MKKIFFATAIILISTTMTWAKEDRKDRRDARHTRKEIRKDKKQAKRETNKNGVSYQTIQHFTKDFPEANTVRYNKLENFDKVSFDLGKKSLHAYYGFDGKLVGTIQEKVFSDLPEVAQKDIKTRYKDYNITNVLKYDDRVNNDNNYVFYGIPFDRDNYFVSLENAREHIMVEVDLSGYVSYFSKLK